MTVKTDVSRFHIHDELTAPDGSAPLLKSIQTAGGTVSKFIGILAESPPVLRAYTRLRNELRASRLCAPRASGSASRSPSGGTTSYTLTQYSRTARAAGLGLDEVACTELHLGREGGRAARAAPRDARSEERPPHHLVEEARRQVGTTRRSSEAVAELALAEFESLFASVAALPQEGDPAVPRTAA